MSELSNSPVFQQPANVNQGQTWDGWTKHTVKLPAPNAGHLHAVSLHTGFVSSCCNDNWNVERVQVVAMTDPKYDAMLVDSDHDGIVDGADNCPNIANSLQEDTNYLAEYVTEQRAGCTDFEKTCPTLDQVPSVTQPPPGDLAKFIDAFHKVFPGDACDPVVSTQGGQDGVPFKSGLQGPCQQVFIPGGQNTKPAPTSCEEQENTQLSFQSWTGNSLGSAAPVTGQTLPSFCACGPTNDSPDQQVLNCVVSTSQGGSPCIVADDRSLPGGPVSSGWQPMQQRIFPPKTPAYTMALTQFGSTFQERIFGHPDDSVTSNWDFVADLALYGQAGATHLDGVLWSHVEPYSTMPVCPDRTSGTSCLFTDLNNHYIATTGLLSAGVWFVGTPGPSLVFHIGSWFEVGPGDPMWLPWLALPQSTSGMQVLSLVGTQPSLVTSSFSASALTLLAGVAAGTSDLLVGDDVATGIRHATTPLAAVVVVHGTTAVQGALRVGAGLPQGISVSPIGVVDPPDLRAYAAYDATLYSLHVAQNGASLTALDVQAALGSIQSSTTMSLYGVVPVNPTALVWDRFNRTLYAMDQVPDGQGHSFLRLLNVDVTTGQSFLLWQTTPTNNLPTSTFLSVDQGGHLVLAMVGVNAQSKSEISVLGDAGQPLDSGDFDGNLVLPALAVPAGINVAFADHSTLPVRADFLPWADLESGICSAEWLRVHANTKASPPDALASAALTCNNKK